MSDKIAVVGAGPSGIMAAGFAGARGKDVVLVEKNEKIGKKLYITGKGRCNITNNLPIEDFFDYIITNNNFLYSALYGFTNEDLLKLLHGYGLKTKVERGDRVFPTSNKSSDVIKTLEKFLHDNNVSVRLNTQVKDINYTGNSFTIRYSNNNEEKFDSIIIATGGKSYPTTGSTGDGYCFAKKLGHTIVPLKPALVPCEVEEAWIKELQGLSLKNVNLSTYINGKKYCEEFGEMLFTHFGISGPIVLSTSNKINKHIDKDIEFIIDLKPALSREKLDRRILKDFNQYNNKQIINGLKDLLPNTMIPIILQLSKIDEREKVNQITKEERECLLDNIKGMKLKFKKFRPIEEAIVTSGGISTVEINPSTMESKLIKGLFFAGELIDVDALTGGFNLQIAYSTGYLAGTNC